MMSEILLLSMLCLLFAPVLPALTVNPQFLILNPVTV